MLLRKSNQKLIAITMCVLLLFSFVLKPLKANAVDLVLTPTITVIIGAALVACGISVSSAEEMQAVIEFIWDKMPEEQKTYFSTITGFYNVAGKYIVQISKSVWDSYTDIIHTYFGEEPEETGIIYTGDIGTVYITPDADIVSPEFLTQGRTDFFDYTTQQGGATIRYFDDGTYFNVKITLPDKTIEFRNRTNYGETRASWQVRMPLVRQLEYGNALYLRADIFGTSGSIIASANNAIYSGSSCKITTSTETYYIKSTDTTVYRTDTSEVIYDQGSDHPYAINVWTYNQIAAASGINYNTAVDYYPGIGTKTPGDVTSDGTDDVTIKVPTTVPDVIEAAPADVIVTDITDTMIEYPTTTPDETINKYKAPSYLLTKFPFCIPYDIYNAVAIMAADPVPPRFEIPFNIEKLNFEYTMVIDFSELGMDELAEIVRWFLSAIFTLGLIVITRNVIKG